MAGDLSLWRYYQSAIDLNVGGLHDELQHPGAAQGDLHAEEGSGVGLSFDAMATPLSQSVAVTSRRFSGSHRHQHRVPVPREYGDARLGSQGAGLERRNRRLSEKPGTGARGEKGIVGKLRRPPVASDPVEAVQDDLAEQGAELEAVA